MKNMLIPFEAFSLKIAIIFLVCVVGLSAQDGFAKNNVKKAQVKKIIIDKKTVQETLPAWLAYAGTRQEWIEKKYYQKHPEATRYSYTFSEELEAFKNMAAVWKETKDGSSDLFLDSLEMVERADYLSQYVWTYFRNMKWDASTEPKGMKAFQVWQSQKLPNHVPEQRVQIEMKR